MFLLSAALVACNNDELIGDFSNNEAKELIEGLTLNVSLNTDAATRGAYAGADGGKVFQNFYLEPEYQTTGDAIGDLLLSDGKALHGDMIGLCLANGGQAITNLPFYIAGYGSASDTPGATGKIFTFADQAEVDGLYYLGLADGQAKDDALYKTDPARDKADAQVAASVKLIKNVAAGAALGTDVMDVRKGIMRTNAGVMTGNYVAYYPYNKSFVEPDGIPVREISAITATGENLADDEATAIKNSNFYDNMFACSYETMAVNGGTKAGDVSLVPITGAIVFQIYNTGSANSPSIKMITVSATENPKSTDFALNGKMSLGATNTFTVGDKTTNMVGVSFNAAEITANTPKESAKYAMLPCYTTVNKKVTVSVYSVDGKVATFSKTAIPGNGKAVTYTIDLNGAIFTDAPRYVYDEASFKSEAQTAGTLILLDDITVTSGSAITLNQALTIQGNHTLTLEKGSAEFTVSAALTCEEGVKLVLGDQVQVSGALKCDDLTVKGTPTFGAAAVTATSMTIAESATASLAEATIGTLTNNGTFTTAVKQDKKVSVNTFENNGTATVAVDTELAAETLNGAAGSTLTVNGTLTSTTISTAAGTTEPMVSPAEITVGATGTIDATTVTNAGTLSWESTEDMSLNVTNTGTFAMNEDCNFAGSLENSGNVLVKVDKTVTGISGTITNTKGIITVNGTLVLTGTALDVKAGVVVAVGQVNGYNSVTIAEGAEYVKTVTNEAELNSALGNELMAGKYTGVRIGTSGVTALGAITTTKKIYLAQNLTLNEDSELADVIVEGNVTLKSIKATTINTITINGSAKLTIGENSSISVTGVITNNGEYDSANGAVVTCAGIDGEGGKWTKYPNF